VLPSVRRPRVSFAEDVEYEPSSSDDESVDTLPLDKEISDEEIDARHDAAVAMVNALVESQYGVPSGPPALVRYPKTQSFFGVDVVEPPQFNEED